MKLLPILTLIFLAQAHLFSGTRSESAKHLEESPIRFERIKFQDADLQSVLAWISTESKKLDPEGEGFTAIFFENNYRTKN